MYRRELSCSCIGLHGTESVCHCLLGSVSSALQDLSCYGFIKIFESQLLTETFRGSAQARPKQALHDTSYDIVGKTMMFAS